MSQLVHNIPPKNHTTPCGDLMKMAQRELAAFLGAVRELFGSEQAKLSAEDWLHELAEIEALPVSTGEWRRITINAAARLANRVNASFIPTGSQTLARAMAQCNSRSDNLGGFYHMES